jgi:hypothetical protein
VTNTTSAAFININSNLTDQYEVTALAVSTQFNTPTGTPNDGQALRIRIKDNGSPQSLTWVTSISGFRVIGVTLPATTVANKVTYVSCVWNSQDTYWDVLQALTQA